MLVDGRMQNYGETRKDKKRNRSPHMTSSVQPQAAFEKGRTLSQPPAPSECSICPLEFSAPLALLSAESSSSDLRIYAPPSSNVVKTLINHQFGNGLSHLFMVIWGMVYYCFNHITKK